MGVQQKKRTVLAATLLSLTVTLLYIKIPGHGTWDDDDDFTRGLMSGNVRVVRTQENMLAKWTKKLQEVCLDETCANGSREICENIVNIAEHRRHTADDFHLEEELVHWKHFLIYRGNCGKGHVCDIGKNSETNLTARSDSHKCLVKARLILSQFRELNEKNVEISVIRHQDAGERAFNLVKSKLKDEKNTSAPYLLCRGDDIFDIGRGFGSRLNEMKSCLEMALLTGRQLLLKRIKDFYIDPSLFQTPVSQPENIVTWLWSHKPKKFWNGRDNIDGLGMVEFDFVGFREDINYNGSRVPHDIRELAPLQNLWNQRQVREWFMSILTRYAFNLPEKIKSKFAEKRHLLGLDDNVDRCTIGIQVRRSDKSLENAFQPLRKYMLVVEELFAQCDIDRGKKVKRKLFLATDEIRVYFELKRNYPEYEIIADERTMQSAKVANFLKHPDPHNYANRNAVENVAFDIDSLSRVDFVVCTFSSNIGRLVHQLRIARSPDARASTFSVDQEQWFSFGEISKNYQANQKSSEIDQLQFEPGDILTNEWKYSEPGLPHGRFRGTNLRTHQTGFYFRYKVTELPETIVP